MPSQHIHDMHAQTYIFIPDFHICITCVHTCNMHDIHEANARHIIEQLWPSFLWLYKLCLDLKVARTHICVHVHTFVEALRQVYHRPPFTDRLLIMIALSLVFHHHFRTFLITLLATVNQVRTNLKEILMAWRQNFQLLLRFLTVAFKILIQRALLE